MSALQEKILKLREKALSLPQKTGVYVFLGSEGPLYIGKSLNIRKRVLSHLSPPTFYLLYKRWEDLLLSTTAFDFYLTETEREALILENELIKKHSPKYNTRLKDAKTYPFLELNLEDEFPYLRLTRRVKRGSRNLYIGPFVEARAGRKCLELIQKLFKVRTCTGKLKGKKLCVYYHIGLCEGPCEGKVEREEYVRKVENVKEFFMKEPEELKEQFRKEMEMRAKELDFEGAALYRDRLKAVEFLSKYFKKLHYDVDDLDCGYLAENDEGLVLVLVRVRNRKLADVQRTSISPDPFAPLPEQLRSLFESGVEIVANPPLVALLNEAREPETEMEKRLLRMAEANSGIPKDTSISAQLREFVEVEGKLVHLECFDVSHTGGDKTVGSCVRFLLSKPNKSGYRRFKLDTGNDDPASMKELLKRRFHGKENLPDLVVVDGGVQQVRAALSALKELGLKIPVRGIAKGEERLIFPDGRCKTIPPTSPVGRVLLKLRDESHRFAKKYHLQRRNTPPSTYLDGIVGIGTKRKEAILSRFPTAEDFVNADEKEVLKIPGVGRETYRRILQHLLSGKTEGKGG